MQETFQPSRTCAKCKVSKPRDQFANKNKQGQPYSYCRDCHRAKMRRLDEMNRLLRSAEPSPAAQGGEDTYLYALVGDQYVKFGISRNVEKRISELERSLPFRLTLAHAAGPFDKYFAYSTEHLIFARFQKHRLHGEWFDLKSVLREVDAITKQRNTAADGRPQASWGILDFMLAGVREAATRQNYVGAA